MKTWSATSLALLFVALLWPIQAQAADAREGLACLKWTDLVCAQEVVDDLGSDGSVEADLLRARLHFHKGEAEEAAEAMKRVVPRSHLLDQENWKQLYRGTGYTRGGEGSEELAESLEAELGFYVDTAQVHGALTETEIDGVVVLHHAGLERVLVQDAAQAIALARERIAPRLGGDVPGPVRVEIYPDTDSFTTCSGLPVEAVRTTGVVAVQKWNRILISSPRALGKGYGWRDTLVHEWVHYVVSFNSRDQTPIWLQEGLAKSTEMLWREEHFSLEVQKQSLLAGALQSGEWITFEQMHPSMAYLPSAEAAALAYAQVATMMEFLQVQQGRDALGRVIHEVRGGADAQEAVARVAQQDFSDFESDWKAWLGGLDLVGVRIMTLPTQLGGGSEAEYDPVLSRRKDLANQARLGDLMLEQEQYEAALVYYRRASEGDAPPSPMVARQRARALIELGRVEEALSVLEENLRFYPDIADSQKLYGQLLLGLGEDGQALAAFQHAAEYNPFDLEVQQALVELHQARGERKQARRRQELVDILQFES